MFTQKITALYLKDLTKLKEEIVLFKAEQDIWKRKGEILNSPGTLVLHLVGNLKHFIGGILGNTGYVRNRDKEFSDRDIPRDILLKEIDETMVMIETVLPKITDDGLLSEYPVEFIGQKRSMGEMLLILHSHLNYHLGQINYYRRITV